ncbi:MAG: ABC transporter ATP-binding protein [Alphaproteobacteria bacterium]|nr:ABC transporter ATP-binding protein [Alphaproteobacteria bacterium]
MALLEVRNVETYYGPVVALRGVSLDVEAGQIVAVLGANGAGKTTLLKTICGAIDPHAGTVAFEGERLHGRDTWDVAARGIAHVPEGREVFRHLSVHDNLMMGAYTTRDRGRLAEDLARVYGMFPRLEERARQHAGDLSGGEQQMLALGRALMMRPKLMLLDEPSLGLSPLLVKEILDTVKRLNAEHGMTILLVEQNANMALDLADFGYVLEVGRIVLEGTGARLKENDDVKEFYLGIRDHGVRGVRRWKRRKQWR